MDKQRIAIYGGAFYPPGRHHRLIAEALSNKYDEVFVVPSGSGRNDRELLVSNEDRRNLNILNFEGLKVELDFYDLDNEVFTPTYALWERYKTDFPDSELFMVVGPDIVKGGFSGKSQIQVKWLKGIEIWQSMRFAVIIPYGELVIFNDLPPKIETVKTSKLSARSTVIREKLRKGESVDDLLMPNVLEYITDNKLVF